jgi:hypothetical protein
MHSMTDDPRSDEPRNVGGRPCGPEADLLAAKRAEAWRLRTVEQMTFADIGVMLGVSTGTAMRYVQAILAERAPSDEDVEAYRQQLIATAMARSELAFERADELYQDAQDQDRILEGPRGGKIVSTLGPQLYGRAAMWEQRGLHHLDRVARWSGVEALAQAGIDVDAVEGLVAAEAERFLEVIDDVRRKRDQASATLSAAGVGEPHTNGASAANGMA